MSAKIFSKVTLIGQLFLAPLAFAGGTALSKDAETAANLMLWPAIRKCVAEASIKGGREFEGTVTQIRDLKDRNYEIDIFLSRGHVIGGFKTITVTPKIVDTQFGQTQDYDCKVGPSLSTNPGLVEKAK